VAGYDLCKLLVGSHGTLGIVTQVTLKLRPLPESSALVWFHFSSFDQIEQGLQILLKSETRPVAIDVLNNPAARLISMAARTATTPSMLVLCVGVEGTAREVDWQIEMLRQELAPCGPSKSDRIDHEDATRLWEGLTEFPTCADDPLTFQANLLPSRGMEFASRATQLGVAIQFHAGNGILVGQLPDEAATIEQTTAILNELRQLARSARGNLVVLHCDPEWKSRMPMYGDPEPSWGLMQKLKRQLDPLGLLNPGRLIGASVTS
jgi:glycolate oxidase FAD binding subunit